MSFTTRSSRKHREQLSRRTAITTLIIVAAVTAGGFSYYVYRQHDDSVVSGWTNLGTASDAATELGGHSTMTTYACIEKTAGATWTVKAKAELSPSPAITSSYSFILSDWPYKSVTDVPAGEGESPIRQAKSSSWSGKSLATVQFTINPTTSNYIEVMASNKGYAGKILPTPVNELPSASQLANC